MTRTIGAYFFLLLFVFTSGSFPQKRNLELDTLFSNRTLNGKALMGTKWMAGGTAFSFMKMDPMKKGMVIYKYDIPSGKDEQIVTPDNLIPEGETQPVALQNYEWSADNKLMLITGTVPARRTKSGGSFFIYDTEQKKIIRQVSSEKEQANIHFSPDGKKVSFVRGNDLYVYDIADQKETRLTSDGSDVILNGIFDWVYEEEFSIITAYEWSGDSKSIAFWKLDQSQVPEIKIQKWDSLYLNSIDMRYPKAGAKNSTVQIGVGQVESGKVTYLDLGNEKDIYIPRIKFTADPAKLMVQCLNRLQNKLELIVYDAAKNGSKIIYTETDSCWIDIYDDLTFLKKDNSFIWTSERDGYKHIYRISAEGKILNQITGGAWEVDKVLGVDEANNTIYYSSLERGPVYRDLYSIGIDGKNKKLITPLKGVNAVNLAPDFTYYINRYSTMNTLPATTIHKVDGEKIRDYYVSDMSVFDNFNLPPAEFLTFNTTDGVSLNAYMIKPTNFDPSKKYPVLIYNYSGPGSQTVEDTWGGFTALWHRVLADKGYIIFVVDGRGTGGRGKVFKHLVYKNLGGWEVNDQIEGAKYLASLGYVDKDRIGIWGWSYGGYMSALTLVKGADYFKAAVSVAPVIHWKFYDSIYTERYMSLPELNPEGYENSSVLKYTDKLKGKLLLVHGTGDDNVHFQNSVALVNKLTNENRQFQTMFYPEKDHGIAGGKTRQHLFNMITNFILENL